MCRKKLLLLCIINLCLIIVPTISNAKDVNEISFEVKKFTLKGDIPETLSGVEAILLGAEKKKYTLKGLRKLAQDVESAIRKQGYAFHRVIVPPQSLIAGNVNLKVISFALGDITITGNEYFDDENIRRSIPALQEGDAINTYKLSQALKVANYSASKQLKLTFKQSEISNKVKAEIGVIEERPYHISLIGNNAGTSDTGSFRLTLALEHNNLWGLDHSINASYTTSPGHAEDIIQYGISYNIPVYSLKGWVTGYYVSSDADTGKVAGGFDISGSGQMYGVHYLQYLPKFKRLKYYEHWFDIGIDSRFFDNDILFGQDNIGSNVRSVPINLRYQGEFPWKDMKFNFHIEWAKNTGAGSYNNQSDYENNRYGAVQNWDLIRYGMSSSVNFLQWQFRANFSGQYTDQALISGEQIGLGGTYSIRGYSERETGADSGNILHLEMHTPEWKDLHLLTFFDYGQGRRRAAQAGELENWHISSVGLGARWHWQRYLSVSLDWAVALNEVPSTLTNRTQAGDSRLHGSIMLRY